MTRAGSSHVCGAKWAIALAAVLGGVLGASSAKADGAAAAAGGDDLAALSHLSIEQLSQIEVTSVSKRPESLGQAASSIYVITADAIRRSGVTSLPEALRLAPNLEVNRIDALDYSITARGFGGFESAEKLLVLIDGRSVYTPLFAGVDWDQHHVLLDDLDRIEVISGPGGTLWGANAVNGVINITTKSALDTEGTLAKVQVGTLDSDAALRYGMALGGAGAARVYVTAFRRGPSRTTGGDSVHDQWNSVQGGFRYDWAGARDKLTLQGDAHKGDINASLGLPGFVRGQNLLGRWTRQGENGGALQVQAYYDHFAREARLIHDELTTWDLQVQNSFAWRSRHRVVWGAGYRLLSDDFFTLTEPQLLSPPHRRTSIGNIFAQDEITLRPGLLLTLGAKVESNSYTRADLLPNVRLGWRINERQFLWAAVSRGIRDPSRIERDFVIPGVVVPGRMGSEKLIAYEAGYRGRVTDRAEVSASVYLQDYDDVRSNELTPPGVLPEFVGNAIKGRTYGLEVWSDVDVTSWWRLSAGASLIGRSFDTKAGKVDLADFKSVGADPPFWAKLNSQMKLSDRVDLDVGLRFYARTGDAPSAGLIGVPAYLEANARLGWRVRDDLELFVAGENLIHDQHPESVDIRREEIPRSVSVGVTWRP